MSTRRLCTGYHSFPLHVLLCITNIFRNCSLKQPGILQRPFQIDFSILFWTFLEYPPIYQNFSAINFIKSHQQVDQCCFSCSVGFQQSQPFCLVLSSHQFLSLTRIRCIAECDILEEETLPLQFCGITQWFDSEFLLQHPIMQKFAFLLQLLLQNCQPFLQWKKTVLQTFLYIPAWPAHFQLQFALQLHRYTPDPHKAHTRRH